MEEGKVVRNKVMEIFERLNHLYEVSSQNWNNSCEIRNILLGPPEEAKPEAEEDKAEAVGILDRIIDQIQVIHYRLLKTRDESLEAIRQIKVKT